MMVWLYCLGDVDHAHHFALISGVGGVEHLIDERIPGGDNVYECLRCGTRKTLRGLPVAILPTFAAAHRWCSTPESPAPRWLLDQAAPMVLTPA